MITAAAAPVVGTLDVVPDFPMPQLGRERRVSVLLPRDYGAGTRRYPVLYMQDGQNLFDGARAFAGEWQVDETLDRLTRDGLTRGVIVVAVDHGEKSRLDEYAPWRDRYHGVGGRGDQYADFLARTLKPYIDVTYRTRREREATGIAGSSMGGLISLYTAFKYESLFGRVAALSPSLWFAGKRLLTRAKNFTPLAGTRIYLDTGLHEGGQYADRRATVEEAQALYASLNAHAGEDVAVTLTLDRLGAHNETAWRRRFEDAFLWLFESDALAPRRRRG